MYSQIDSDYPNFSPDATPSCLLLSVKSVQPLFISLQLLCSATKAHYFPHYFKRVYVRGELAKVSLKEPFYLDSFATTFGSKLTISHPDAIGLAACIKEMNSVIFECNSLQSCKQCA